MTICLQQGRVEEIGRKNTVLLVGTQCGSMYGPQAQGAPPQSTATAPGGTLKGSSPALLDGPVPLL